MQFRICVWWALLCAMGCGQTPPRRPAGLTNQQAVEAGLDFLVQQQTRDGAWGTGVFERNPAITAFAGFAFLSAGERPGNGPRGEALAKAVDWMLEQESPELPGYFGT